MEIRKIIQRKIERREGGLDLQAHVNAVVAANAGEGQTYVSSQQSVSSCAGRRGNQVRRPQGDFHE